MTDTFTSIAEALPDYEVQRELGRGAMGVVYLGRHRRLDRVVAIKEIAGALADDPDVRSRFLTEARVLASLDHPHIVPIYDYVEDGGRCLLIMEALGGGTVWDRFQRDGLTLSASCALLLDTCAAVDHAHGKGILHRDLKPENLLLSSTGHLKVTDFGIAKVLDGGRTLATIDGSVLGTPAYMAPEQAEGVEVGPPADVYALGAMLYEMLSGRLPHEADAPMALLVARISSDAPALASVAPGVPAAICTVVDQAVARSVDDRIQSAADLARELRRAAGATLGDGWLADETTTGAASTVAPPTIVPSTLVPRPPSRPAPATIAPSSIPADGPEEAVETADPVETGPAPTVDPVPATATANTLAAAESVMRPTALAHHVGVGPTLRRGDLVGIGTVVQPRVPVRLPLVATIVLLVVALLAALAGPRDPAGSGDALATIAIAGQPAGGDEPVVTSLTDPLGIAGLPVTATELSLDVVTAGLTLATATAPVTGGVAEIDLGLRGWLVGGVTEGRLVISEAGAESSAATVILATEQPWWQSGIGAAAIVLALFALAAVESQSRRHDRGRVRMANAIGAAIGAGVVAACGTVVLTLATDRVIALSGWLTPAVLAAAAGCSLTVTRARLARRRRLTWRG